MAPQPGPRERAWAGVSLPEAGAPAARPGEAPLHPVSLGPGPLPGFTEGVGRHRPSR